MTAVVTSGTINTAMPDDFVLLEDVLPDVLTDVRYAGTRNFTGKPVPGYESGKLALTGKAAGALNSLQQELHSAGLALKLFDAYRPQRAVSCFIHWALDLADVALKQEYYPNIGKEEIFARGYLREKSTHSRGSTVDLTLTDKISGCELDMGTPFDFFDARSWPASRDVTAQARANRLLLRSLMLEHGFMPVEEEWWHFTLKDEPYPDTWFDFVVG